MLVINAAAAGCHNILPGLQLPSLLQNVTVLGRYQFILLGGQAHLCVNDLLRFAAQQWNGIKHKL